MVQARQLKASHGFLGIQACHRPKNFSGSTPIGYADRVIATRLGLLIFD